MSLKKKIATAMLGLSLGLHSILPSSDAANINNKYNGSVNSQIRSIDSIIMHYTAGSTVEGAVDTLQKRGYSYHYIIDRDGTIYPLVEESKIAFHAKGPEEDSQRYNHSSIGISLVNYGELEKRENKFYIYNKEYTGEVVNVGSKFWQPYTDKQLKALCELSQDIVKRYNIPINKTHIYGHQDTNMGNPDPGEAFPWEKFYQELKTQD